MLNESESLYQTFLSRNVLAGSCYKEAGRKLLYVYILDCLALLLAICAAIAVNRNSIKICSYELMIIDA